MPEIIFLTERKPFVAKVADWLARSVSSLPWDFSETALVLPTAGAARRVRWELVVRAEAQRGGILPPIMTTPLSLMDRALPPGIADRQACLAAWTRALAERSDDINALLPGFSAPLLFRDSLRIAETLADVCSLLAEGGLTPRSEEVQRLLVHDEERWRQISLLYDSYLSALHAVSLHDPNEARLSAMEQGFRLPDVQRIIIAGVSDLNALSRKFFTCLEEAGVPVTLLVDAPSCEEARFDQWGCPNEGYWSQIPLPIDLADVAVLADAWSEAETVADLLSDSPAGLCLADERLGTLVKGALSRKNREAFDPRGESLATSEVAVIVAGWHRFCSSRFVEDLKILMECPAFQQALSRDSSLAPSAVQAAFDAVRAQSLIDFWPDLVSHVRNAETSPVTLLIAVIEKWRKSFPLDKPQESLPAFLHQIYAGTQLEAASAEANALRAFGEIMERRLHASDVSDPEIAWELLFDAVRASVIYGYHPENAIELNGWLEAAWLPQEFVILSGCAEGVLTASTLGHSFLPESARKALGLPGNAARLARDSYLLHNLLLSRESGAVKCLYARENVEGEPAKPARLLFRRPPEELSARVEALFRDVPSLRSAPARQNGWKLEVPRLAPPSVIRVTGFGDYLTCPMRFYFKHVLRLDTFDPASVEMDAREFGTIFHRVVEDFARDESIRESTDPSAIAAYVAARLDTLIFARHGRRPSLPVRVQQESLRARLHQFASLQAAERAEGWRIVDAEYAFKADDTLILGGLPVTASLDRIEVHERTGRRRILDYKTFGKDKTPEKTHLGPLSAEELLPGEEVLWGGKFRYWKNLQLPLYRALAQYRWPQEDAPLVGYFLLPERLEDSRIEEFPLDEATAHAAIQCADGLAERVRRGIFWPPREVDFDDFQAWFLNESPADVLSEASVAFLAGDFS